MQNPLQSLERPGNNKMVVRINEIQEDRLFEILVKVRERITSVHEGLRQIKFIIEKK